MHRLWKDRFVRRVKPRAGEAILDMAGGTGDIAFRLARRGATVTVADINPDDARGRAWSAPRSAASTGLVWSEENAETLSFADASFDAYTIAFGIRNVTDIPAALARGASRAEARRALLLPRILDHEWPGFGETVRALCDDVVPKIGKVVAHDEDSYRYLVESIRRFPDMPDFEAMIGEAGFVQTKRRADARRARRDPQRLEDLTTRSRPISGGC